MVTGTARPAPLPLLAAGVLALAALFLLHGAATVPFRVAAAFLLLGWFPGYALLRLAARKNGGPPGGGAPEVGRSAAIAAPPDFDPVWAIAAPLALAPIVSTGILILAALAGVPFRTAVVFPVVFGVLLALLPARRGSEGTVGPEARGRRHALVLAAGSAFVIGLVYLVNPWLSWRGDGRFHIGVVAEILRGGLPPTDPFFVGLNLQYMWFFHAYVAALRALSGAPTPFLLSAINVAALFAFVLLVWRASRGLGRSPRESLLAAVLVAFAMGGHGWIFLPIKLLGMFTGTDRGMDAVRSILDSWPPPMTKALGFFAIWMDQAFLLRKFLVGTAVSLAFLSMFLHLETSRRALDRGGFMNLVVVSLAAAGAIVLHPMMGIPEVAVVVAGAVLWWLLGRVRPYADGRAPLRGVLELVAANLAGVLLALPYLRLVTSGKEGESGFPIDFVPAKILSLVAGTLGVGLLGVPWVIRTLSRKTARRNDTWAALWVILMTGFSLFVRFPLERENIDKPTLLTHVAIAFVAGWALAALFESSPGRRRFARAFLFLMIVPINVLVLAGYAGERDPRTYRAHEKEAFRFVDANAPADAIVFDSQDRDRPAVEIQRRQYWGNEQFASSHEYPKAEMDARRAVRDALYLPGGPDETAVQRLKGLAAPVWVVVRAGAAVPGPGWPPGTGPVAGSFAAGDPDPVGNNPAFVRVFQSDDVRVYRLLQDPK